MTQAPNDSAVITTADQNGQGECLLGGSELDGQEPLSDRVIQCTYGFLGSSELCQDVCAPVGEVGIFWLGLRHPIE